MVLEVLKPPKTLPTLKNLASKQDIHIPITLKNQSLTSKNFLLTISSSFLRISSNFINTSMAKLGNFEYQGKLFKTLAQDHIEKRRSFNCLNIFS